MNGDVTDRSQLSDEALIVLVARRDVPAFDVLYRRYARMIYGMSNVMLGHAEADEAVQEVFLRLWDRAGQYDPGRGPYRTWFTALARNQLLNLLRARRPDRRLAIADDVEELLARQPDPSVDVEGMATDRENSQDMATALRQLPEEQRRVLVLAYFGGLSHAQIAQELELPLGTVKKRVRLGLQKMRVLLAGEGQAPETIDRGTGKALHP